MNWESNMISLIFIKTSFYFSMLEVHVGHTKRGEIVDKSTGFSKKGLSNRSS